MGLRDQGVYETKIPLALHALLQLGCVCKVDSKARNRKIRDGWSLNDLHMKTTTECSYLLEDLPYIFLYHRFVFCFTKSENDLEMRSCFLKSWSGKINLFIRSAFCTICEPFALRDYNVLYWRYIRRITVLFGRRKCSKQTEFSISWFSYYDVHLLRWFTWH